MKAKKKNTRAKAIFDYAIIILVLIISLLCSYIVYLIWHMDSQLMVTNNSSISHEKLIEKYKEIALTYEKDLYAIVDINNDDFEDLIIKHVSMDSNVGYSIYSCRTNNKNCEKIFYLGNISVMNGKFYKMDDGTIAVSGMDMNAGKYVVYSMGNDFLELKYENDYLLNDFERYKTGDKLIEFNNFNMGTDE